MCVKKLIFACINKVDPKQPCKFGNNATHIYTHTEHFLECLPQNEQSGGVYKLRPFSYRTCVLCS